MIEGIEICCIYSYISWDVYGVMIYMTRFMYIITIYVVVDNLLLDT
jgi:hypothetical protein